MRRTEGGWAATVDGRSVVLFDPGECLKVGRHYSRLGVVYEVPRKGGDVDYNGEWHRTIRGLLRWEGGPQDIAAAAARLALTLAGVSSPSSWLIGRVVKGWGSDGLWTELWRGLELGRELEVVSEVMTS